MRRNIPFYLPAQDLDAAPLQIPGHLAADQNVAVGIQVALQLPTKFDIPFCPDFPFNEEIFSSN